MTAGSEIGETVSGDDRTVGVPSHAVEDHSSALLHGSSLGRYLLLDCLGKGGMGVVHRAYDPKLHREIALKVMRRRPRAGDDARIVREAQAMAQLSHPNVVAVYDVDRVDGVLFIAMELVPGPTLAEWLGMRVRTPVEIAAVMRQAALGLAAAHDVGLVHRDFKPGNVIVGDDGRVRVMDFGLARGGGEASRSGSNGGGSPSIEIEPGSSLSAALTEYGAVLGTPSYMAPEQHLGGTIDGRADQYSFCVTLYEALWGIKPFRTDELDAMVAAKCRGIERVPSTPKVPPWLQRIVLRGLRLDAPERFASMHEVAEALARDPAAQRSRTARVTAVIGLLGAVGGTWAWSEHVRTDACAADPLATEWNEVRREAIASAFRSTALGYADETAERIDEALHAWTAGYRDSWQGNCNAARGGVIDARRARCLDDARMRLTALLESLTRDVDVATVQHAAALVATLPRPSACDEAIAVRSDQGDSAAIAELRARLVDADMATRSAHYARAASALDDLRPSIEHGGDDGLRAELALADSLLAKATGELARAEARAFDAYVIAIAAERDDIAARAATASIDVVGVALARREEGRAWMRTGDALVARRAREDDIAIDQIIAKAGLRLALGDTEAALTDARNGAALAERVHGPDHLQTARAYNDVANALDTLGRPEEAQGYYERALELLERGLGPHHPDVAGPLSNLGNVSLAQGKLAEALAWYERAIEVLSAGVGAEQATVAMLEYNAAGALAELGRTKEARTRLEHAVATLRATLGNDHPQLAYPLTTLGRALAASGDRAQARRVLEEALAIRERHHEAAPLLAETRLSLVELLADDPAERDHCNALVDAVATDCTAHPEAACVAALELVAKWRAQPRR